MQFIFALIILINYTLAREFEYCYNRDDDPYFYLATKTAYTFIDGKSRMEPIPHCKPLQFWMIARHGTRYPTAEKIAKLRTLPKLRDDIIHNHETMKLGHLCDEDLENLKIWFLNSNLREDMAKRMTPQGEEDSRLFAQRLKDNFPELLRPHPVNITAENYVFRSTESQRSQSNLDAFMEGLFGFKNAVTVPSVSGADVLLKAYKNCTNWNSGEESDANTLEERNKFMITPEYTNLIKNVSRRLGFVLNLSAETIGLMYDMCRFEKSWDVTRLSPWCSVFSKEELKILEYAEDIAYYYGTGYGREVNAKLGCFPLQDMFTHFKQLEKGDNNGEPKGIFYFTHSVTMLSFLGSMGIGKDEQKLLPSNYKDMAKRHWRTSFLGPFNSNLIAIFYKCDDRDNPNKVMFYLQEKPLPYEGCKGGLCDWEYLKNKLGTIAVECNPEFCWPGNLSNFNIASINLLIILTILSTWWT